MIRILFTLPNSKCKSNDANKGDELQGERKLPTTPTIRNLHRKNMQMEEITITQHFHTEEQ